MYLSRVHLFGVVTVVSAVALFLEIMHRKHLIRFMIAKWVLEHIIYCNVAYSWQRQDTPSLTYLRIFINHISYTQSLSPKPACLALLLVVHINKADLNQFVALSHIL